MSNDLPKNTLITLVFLSSLVSASEKMEDPNGGIFVDSPESSSARHTPVLNNNQENRSDTNNLDELLLNKIEQLYTNKGSITPEVVVQVRSELPFIVNNVELQKVHSQLSRKLTEKLISYKEVDTSTHKLRVMVPAIATACLLMTSGAYTIHNSDNKDWGYPVGLAQAAVGFVGLSCSIIDHYSISNKIYTYLQGNLLPFYYSNDEINNQSSFIALYMMAINNRTRADQWSEKNVIDSYVEKKAKFILNAYVDETRSLSYYLKSIGREKFLIDEGTNS